MLAVAVNVAETVAVIVGVPLTVEVPVTVDVMVLLPVTVPVALLVAVTEGVVVSVAVTRGVPLEEEDLVKAEAPRIVASATATKMILKNRSLTRKRFRFANGVVSTTPANTSRC